MTTYNLKLAIGLDGVPQVVGGLKQVEAQVEQAGGRTQTATGRMAAGMTAVTTASGRMATEHGQHMGRMSHGMTAIEMRVQSLTMRIMNLTMAAALVAAPFVALGLVLKSTYGEIEQFNLSAIQMAALISSFQKGGDPGENYRKAKEYAEGLVPVLETIDAETAASASGLRIITEEMIKQRVLLDGNNTAAVEGFKNLANAASVIASGYQNQEIQLRQEIRSLMQGEVDMNSQLSQQINAMVGGGLKDKVELWKKEGTIIENLGGLLRGYGAASEDIGDTWSAIGSTMSTIWSQISRGGFTEMYRDVNALLASMNDYLKAHAADIGGVVRQGYLAVVGTLETIGELWQAIAPAVMTVLRPVWELTKMIFDGWGMIAYAVLPEVAERIKAMLYLVYDFAALLDSTARLLIATLTFNVDGMKAYANDLKTVFGTIVTDFKKAFGPELLDEVFARVDEYQRKAGQKNFVELPGLDTPVDEKALKEAQERAEQYAAALHQLADARRASNPLLSEEARETERLRIQYDNLIAKYPEHRTELERNLALDLRQLQLSQQVREEKEQTKKAFTALTAAMAEGQAVTESVATAQEKFNAEIEKLNDLFMDGYVALDPYWRKVAQLEQTLEETADKKVLDGLKDQLELLKLTGRELAVQQQLRQLTADATDEQRDQVRQLTEQLYTENTAIEAQKAQAEALKAVWEQALGRIDALFVDLWESGLQGFKDFADSLKNTFRRLLAELIQMAVRNRIVIPIAAQMGMTSKAAAADGSSATGSAGSSLSLGSLLNPGALAGMQEGAAVFIADNLSGSLGNAIGSMSSALFGGLTAGLGTALIGGLTTGNWAQSAVSGLGSGVGMFFGGPLGAMVGGLRGNLVGGMFGGKPSDRTAWGSVDLQTGSLSDLGNMTGKKQSAAATLDARTAMLEATAAIADGIRQLGGELSGALTLQVGERDGIQVNIGNGVQRLGSDIEAALVAISEMLVRNADWTGLLENGVFGVLTAEMQTGIRNQVEGGMDAQGVQGLVQYFGQLDAIMEQVTEAIQLADMDDYQRAVYGINKQFDAMADQLRSLGVDLAKYTDLEKARGLALRDVAEQFGQSASAILREQLDQSLTTAQRAAEALRQVLGGSLGGASPERLYFERLTAFNQARAAGRDAEIPELGKALLEASRAYNASSPAFQRDLEQVTQALGAIAGMEGSPTLSAAERQVQLLDDIRVAMESNNQILLAQLTEEVSQFTRLRERLERYLAPPERSITIPTQPVTDLPAAISDFAIAVVQRLTGGLGQIVAQPRPSFAVGSPYIPADMTANIHQGEMIIDRASAQVLRKYGIPAASSDNRDVVAALSRIESRLEQVEAHTGAGVRVNQSVGQKLIAINERQAAASAELAGKARAEASK